MPKSNSEDYSSIAGEETPWLSDTALTNSKPRSKAWRTRTQIIIHMVGAVILLLCGLIIGQNMRESSHKYHQSPKDSDLTLFRGVNFNSHPKRFNGSFFRRSQYSGSPTPQLDEARARFTETGSKWMSEYPALLSVSMEDAAKSTANPIETAVRLKDDHGRDGHMASLEIFHHIHCLDMIRKFIHFDYYASNDPTWAEHPLVRQHADHCVDMLRDVLMYNSDTGLITYHWIKGRMSPLPDFSTLHSCRDPEQVLKWTRENEVHITEEILKEEGATELQELF